MAENKISYLNRTFEDYQGSLKEYVQRYYPDIAKDLDDASIGSWMIDLVASIADNLSYHIDRAYGETCLESAQEKSSIYAMARSNGLKIPGPKGAMTEVAFSCILPPDGEGGSSLGNPNWKYAPRIKKGTKLSSGNQVFEVMSDIVFGEMVNDEMVWDCNIEPNTNAKGDIVSYTVTKYATVVAGETKIYSQVLNNEDIVPFMEILIPDQNVMNVESIIFKDGDNYNSLPESNEFMQQQEYVAAASSITNCDTYRFFEVDSLLQQYRWGDDISNFKKGNQELPQYEKYTYGYYDSESGVTIPVASVVKGQWYPLTQKFTTEFTDKGYLKVIFGSGESAKHNVNISEATTFTKHQISKMIRNNSLGKLPEAGWSMYIQYRAGGGTSSNIAKNSLTTIIYQNIDFPTCFTTSDEQKIAAEVKSSLKVTNTIPGVSGKDAPTIDEIKAMIKYNNASQERCVTIKDYVNRVMMMPPKYGCPFRVSGIEENNKAMLYVLGLDYLGKLTDVLPDKLVENMQNYLSMYRTINDFVEIKSGRIINLSFEADVYVDKNYNTGDVVKNVINTIKEYMDINNHELGDDIYVGDIEKEVSKVDGVLNVFDFRVYNEFGDNYSSTRTEMETIDEGEEGRERIDLEDSDYILKTNSDTMFEIKYPESDIKCRVKTR